MTDVFFIAYQFPPLNVGGSFRPLKFVKYFNDFDIKPIIFTLATNDYPKVYKNKIPENKLSAEIDTVQKEIIEVRTDDILGSRKNKLLTFSQIYFNITKSTEKKKWEPYFFEAAKKALLKNKPKAIIVTAPPFGIIDLALKLSKQTNIPLIIDMRDSLSMWVSQPYGSFLHYKLTLNKEKKWFKHAHTVIAVTQQMISDWEKAHKNLSTSKFKVIPNGYDEDIKFTDLKISPSLNKINLGYVGSFYYNPESRASMFAPWYKKKLHRKLQYVPRKEDWLYRSPFFIFKTIRFLLDNHPEYKNKLNVNFIGLKPTWFDNMVTEFNLESNVNHLGFLSFNDAVEFQKNCDALLLTSVKVINGEDYCIAGKTFDYIAQKKPIIGFVTSGAQKQFIKKSNTGIICNPDNTQESAIKLKELFKKGTILIPNSDFLTTFHRKNITSQLAQIIHSL